MPPPLLVVEEVGAGPPLVLLHGLATSSVICAAVLGELSRMRRVVTVDLPDFFRRRPRPILAALVGHEPGRNDEPIAFRPTPVAR